MSGPYFLDSLEKLEECYRKYKRPLFLFNWRNCGNVDLAADITAEAFCRTAVAISEGKIIKRPFAWLKQVSKFAWMDHLREMYKEAEEDTGETNAKKGGGSVSSFQAPLAGIFVEQLRGILCKLPEDLKAVIEEEGDLDYYGALKKLFKKNLDQNNRSKQPLVNEAFLRRLKHCLQYASKDDRFVLRLSFEGLGHSKIASLMGKSQVAVRKILQRARATLTECLDYESLSQDPPEERLDSEME